MFVYKSRSEEVRSNIRDPTFIESKGLDSWVDLVEKSYQRDHHGLLGTPCTKYVCSVNSIDLIKNGITKSTI